MRTLRIHICDQADPVGILADRPIRSAVGVTTLPAVFAADARALAAVVNSLPSGTFDALCRELKVRRVAQ